MHENIFCHEISKHFINDHEKYRNPCTQVLKYLSYLESKPSLDYRACCKYLNYWLYDNVINNKKSEYNALKLYQQFKNLDNDLLDHNICEKYIEDINDDIFSELKELYTLFDKFNHIKKETTSNIANICKIADECSTLYRKQEQKCAANYKNIFCNELENFRKVYNSYMASKIKCNAESIILPSFLKNNLAAIIIVPFVIILIVSFILFILYKVNNYFIKAYKYCNTIYIIHCYNKNHCYSYIAFKNSLNLFLTLVYPIRFMVISFNKKKESNVG